MITETITNDFVAITLTGWDNSYYITIYDLVDTKISNISYLVRYDNKEKAMWDYNKILFFFTNNTKLNKLLLFLYDQWIDYEDRYETVEQYKI